MKHAETKDTELHFQKSVIFTKKEVTFSLRKFAIPMDTSYQQTQQCCSFLFAVLYFLDDLQTPWK